MIIPSLTFTGGGDNKIFDQKVKVEAKSKVGSTDNIKHKAGGGNVKVGGTHQRILIKANHGGLNTK